MYLKVELLKLCVVFLHFIPSSAKLLGLFFKFVFHQSTRSDFSANIFKYMCKTAAFSSQFATLMRLTEELIIYPPLLNHYLVPFPGILSLRLWPPKPAAAHLLVKYPPPPKNHVQPRRSPEGDSGGVWLAGCLSLGVARLLPFTGEAEQTELVTKTEEESWKWTNTTQHSALANHCASAAASHQLRGGPQLRRRTGGTRWRTEKIYASACFILDFVQGCAGVSDAAVWLRQVAKKCHLITPNAKNEAWTEAWRRISGSEVHFRGIYRLSASTSSAAFWFTAVGFHRILILWLVPR